MTDGRGSDTIIQVTAAAGDVKLKLNPGVHYIGKLNIKVFIEVLGEIQTDDTVLTDERIVHIQDHHPGDYENYKVFIPKMIKEPDYVIRSKAYATAITLKSVSLAEETELKLILRLKTATDNPNYKNSIITFQKINNREYARLINKAKKEGTLVYKRPDM